MSKWAIFAPSDQFFSKSKEINTGKK